MTAILLYSFITLKETDLENGSPSICGIVGHFVNTLTANGKYYLHNSEILRQAFRMELSKKLLTFLEFYAPFLKSISYFEFFEKKDDPHCLYISKFTECEKCG